MNKQMNNNTQVKKCFAATSGCTQTQCGVANTLLSTIIPGNPGTRVALVGPSGVGKAHIIRSIMQVFGKAPHNQLRSVLIECRTAAGAAAGHVMPKRGHVMMQELVEALNPAQNTNGYTFRGLEHLLENSLVKAIPRAIPVYIFVVVDDGDVSTHHSDRTGTDVGQFLTAVHAVQTRHPNVTVVLATAADTLPVVGISSTYTRIAVPAVTVDDAKEVAKRVAKNRARMFDDDATLARAAAYGLQHPEPLDRITRLIRIASTLTPAHSSAITIHHLDTAQTRLELAKINSAVTPIITALSSPQTGYFLIQAASALTRNGYETVPLPHLHRVVNKLYDDIPISPDTVTKTLTELIRTRLFNKVSDTHVALSPTLTKPHTLNAITGMWDPFSDHHTSTQTPSTTEEITNLHLTYIAIQSALVKLERALPYLEIPTQTTLYPIYLETCTDLQIQPKTPTKFYDAVARLHQKELVTVARDPTGQGRPNLITSSLTKNQTGALARHYRRLTQPQKNLHHHHHKNLDAINADLNTMFATAPSQKTALACIIDLAKKLGKNTLRKLDVYNHYCSTCHSTPIKRESFWALITRLVTTLHSFISSIRCFFNGRNEARILIISPAPDTGPPPPPP